MQQPTFPLTRPRIPRGGIDEPIKPFQMAECCSRIKRMNQRVSSHGFCARSTYVQMRPNEIDTTADTPRSPRRLASIGTAPEDWLVGCKP